MDRQFSSTVLFEKRVFCLEMKSFIKTFRKELLIFQIEQYTATLEHIGLFLR